jgi:tetratricopeptide (TPR) repeat protein
MKSWSLAPLLQDLLDDPELPATLHQPLTEGVSALQSQESNLFGLMADLAGALVQQENYPLAATVWAAVRDDFPSVPAGWVGVAFVAGQQRHWAEAMSHWNAAILQFPNRVQPTWHLGLGRAMFRLNLPQEAKSLLSRTLQQAPDELAIRQLLAQVHIALGEFGDALDLIEARLDVCLQHIPTQFTYIKLLTRRGRHQEAARIVEHLLASIQNFDALPSIVRMMPEVQGINAAGHLYLMAKDRLDAFEQAGLSPEQSLLGHELRLRLDLLLNRNEAFLAQLEQFDEATLPEGRHRDFMRLASKLARPRDAAFQDRKIFGIGLSKTATSSLSEALSMLGFHAAHYQNPLTYEVLDVEQAALFDVCCDTPICHIFETLYHTYPNALFIYTTRPLDTWLHSLRKHHQLHFGTSHWDELRVMTAAGRPPSPAIEASLYFNHPDALTACQVYDRRVREFFAHKPSERFMEFSVFQGHGWRELCQFVNVPVPEAPFPHENPVR